MKTEIERAKESIKEYRKGYGQSQLPTDCIIQLMMGHAKSEQLLIHSVVKPLKAMEEATMKTKMALDQANVDYTNVQSQNAIQDNLKQLVVALDKSYQEWAKLSISATKEGQDIPEQPNVQEMYATAQDLIQQTMTQPQSNGKPKEEEPQQEELAPTPDAIEAFLGQGGGGMM